MNKNDMIRAMNMMHPTIISQFTELREILAEQEGVSLVSTTPFSVVFLVKHDHYEPCSYANACCILLERVGYKATHHHSNFDEAVYLTIPYKMTIH